MTHIRVLVAAGLLVAATPCSALQAADYLQMLSAGPGGQTEIAVSAYRQGIAESITSIHLSSLGRVEILGVPQVCIPNGVTIDQQLIARAIELEIGSPSRPVKLSDESAKVYVGVHAFRGLKKMFPCGS